MSTAKRASHKLFEPTSSTNFIVGNWSRYCKPHSMVTEKTKFCKFWIGIKWNGAKFIRESDNKPISWTNFEHSENYELQNGIIDGGYSHQCKYRICNQTTNCHRWLRSKLIKMAKSKSLFLFLSQHDSNHKIDSIDWEDNHFVQIARFITYTNILVIFLLSLPSVCTPMLCTPMVCTPIPFGFLIYYANLTLRSEIEFWFKDIFEKKDLHCRSSSLY